MGAKKVNLVISLKDNVSAGLKRISKGIKAVGMAFKSVAKVGAIAFGGLSVAAFALGKTIQKSFEFEKARSQLKGLLGTTALAEKRFKELRDFAASTPFQLPDLLEASKHLTIFTEGVLGSAKSLKAIGDAAATTGQGIQDVSFWVGRAYSMLKGGKPFGEAAMRLQEMGILTPKVRSEMEALQKSGASFSTIWGKMNTELGRFGGAMEELSQTGLGKWSTLLDNVGIAMAAFGDELADLAKDGIDSLTSSIKGLVDDGTITKWAKQANDAFQIVSDTIKVIATGGGDARGKVISSLMNVIVAGFVEAAQAAVDVLGKAVPVIGKILGDSLKAAALGVNQDKISRTEEDFVANSGKRFANKQGISRGSDEARAFRADLVAKLEGANRKDRLKKLSDEIGASIGDAGGGLKGAMSEFLDVLAVEAVKLEEGIKKPAKDIADAITVIPDIIADEAIDQIESSPEIAEASKEIAKAIVSGVAPSKSAVEATPVSGFGQLSASLSASGVSRFDRKRIASTAASAERRGREEGISGFGDVAGGLAQSGLRGQDLKIAIADALSAEIMGRDASDINVGEEVVKTNELIMEQNKLLDTRLGGVKG